MPENNRYIRWFEELGSADVPLVGGKNASLGEMIATLKERGIRVPGGFATTAVVYRNLLADNRLTDKIGKHLEEFRKGKKSLAAAGKAIRRLFRRASFPDDSRRERH